MNKSTPAEVLDKLLLQAKEGLYEVCVSSPRTKEKVESICKCSNKSPIRFLMSCMLAKLDRPSVDIRKPYTEIEGNDTYSGRHYDEKYIEPLIHKHRLPCNATTAYLTPTFRNHDRVLAREMTLVGRPRRVYTITIELLDDVYRMRETPEDVLREILRQLLIIRQEDESRFGQMIAGIKNRDGYSSLSCEEIITLIYQYLSCKRSSRLPVLVVAAAYRSVKDLIGEENRPLESHNAADKQTGSVGDIEIVIANDDKIVTCYEMKSRKVTKTDIDVALQKVSHLAGEIDNCLFITTDPIEAEVDLYAKSRYEKTGIEFAILDCLGFIRHFLHFFPRRRNDFLNSYQDMVISEPTSSVSQPLKEAFLALRRAAENDN